jgi:NADH dehydrogenase
VDSDLKNIYTNIGQLHYDYLIVATGSKTNFFGNESLKQYGMPLKTVTQALDLRSLMLQNFEKALLISDITQRESTINFVIVGGGPTGVELSGAMGELKNHVLPNDYPELDVRRMQIHLIEAGSKLLPGLSKVSSDKSLEYLKKLGVHVWLDTMVTSYDGAIVNTNTGKSLNAKNLVWSAGVMGNSIEGFSEDKFNKSGRILVNEYNQVTGLTDIFVLGDLACMVEEPYPNGHPMVAPVAMQQGDLLAKNLIKLESGKPLKAFTYQDKGSMATIGRNKAVVELAKLKWHGAFAWFIWMFVHLISLVGFRNKTIVLVNWLWNYFNYDRGIRLIIRPFKREKQTDESSHVV